MRAKWIRKVHLTYLIYVRDTTSRKWTREKYWNLISAWVILIPILTPSKHLSILFHRILFFTVKIHDDPHMHKVLQNHTPSIFLTFLNILLYQSFKQCPETPVNIFIYYFTYARNRGLSIDKCLIDFYLFFFMPNMRLGVFIHSRLTTFY